MRFCQLEKVLSTIFILVFLVGCSDLSTKIWGHGAASGEKPVQPIERVHELNSGHPIIPSWFKIPSTFTIFDYVDRTPTHPFFDVTPNWRPSQRLINYVAISPAESAFQYDLDLLSGKLYKVRDNCANEDLWGAYKEKVDRPNFTLAIIPQVYNHQRLAQKILIFKEHFEQDKFIFVPEESREARIIGSVILEYCDHYPCDSRKRWKATQILVGVDVLDAKYGQLNSLAELKNVIEWPYTKAYLENQFGAHQLANNFKPAYRVISELGVEETLKYFKDKSFVINVNKLQNWRKTCFSLYDSMWKEVTRIRSEKLHQQDKFHDFFLSFYMHDLDQFVSCQKLVRAANINEEPARHWFFTYVSAFVNLEQNGFVYSCKDKVWSYNARVDIHHLVTTELKEMRLCKPSEFEAIFDHAINAMSTMQYQTNKSFRFIEYDTQHGGSHQKLYSWIQQQSLNLACDKNIRSPEIFPVDIYWNPFRPDEVKSDGDWSK